MELKALMYSVAFQTGAMNPAAAEGWPSANRDVERTLAAQGCMFHVVCCVFIQHGG
jgi:ubiquitin carboxyl-terminal hydrolase 25